MSVSYCFLILFSIVAGLLATNCKFDVKLEQHLVNKGFHRNITYWIYFDSNLNRHLFENCIVGLDQMLPAGVFANPDELRDLRRLQKLSAIPKNRINVELPAEQSEPTGVFIITKLDGGQGETWLPVHARYHRATSEGGLARNLIVPPRMYLRCPDHRLDRCHKSSTSITFLCNGISKEKCVWREVPITVVTNTLVLAVPVGNTSSYELVACATAAVVIVGSLYLLHTIHEYNRSSVKKAL